MAPSQLDEGSHRLKAECGSLPRVAGNIQQEGAGQIVLPSRGTLEDAQLQLLVASRIRQVELADAVGVR